jgi:type IV secretory pathway TrbL component
MPRQRCQTVYHDLSFVLLCLHVLPTFVIAAAAASVLAGIAGELAAAFHTREDLRGIISFALVRMCKQARAVALAAAQGSIKASATTRAAIQGLGLVSGAAAAIPGAGKGEDDAADDDEQQQHAGSDDEDDEDEYGQQQQQRQNQRGSAGRKRGGAAAADDEDAGPDAAESAPAAFDADVALAQLGALRALSLKWLRLMCKVFIEVRGVQCFESQTLFRTNVVD